MKLKVLLLFKRMVLMTSCLLFVAAASMAQRTITGIVNDESGVPLIGATILVKGTATGTITDIDGNFSLDVNDGDVLVATYTGYADQEIIVGAGQSNLLLVLVAGTLLDEVVVTGYGTLKAKEVTSSITSVKAEDFNRGNITSPEQLLQGKVAGLTVSRPGSDPNGSFNIRLRAFLP